MKKATFKNIMKEYANKFDFDGIIDLAVLILFSSFIIYRVYGGTFSYTATSLTFLIVSVAMKVFSKKYKPSKIINYAPLILIFTGAAIIITIFLSRPQYTLKDAREIVIKDAKSRITNTIEVNQSYKQKKQVHTNYFVKYDYVIRIEYNEKCYEYVFDPISGQYSVRTFDMSLLWMVKKLN
ncbi:hypothetical protein [Clostridium tunisiense]|uniref:hypothetical protein n=1 Tax=Clostridium tunisiense TaxID=219748 RepID=UPI0002DF5ED7|nr:hypothetical protein [Clostridium tunisiense]